MWKLRPRISMIEQKLQSKVQPREVSITSILRPRNVYPSRTRASRRGGSRAPSWSRPTGRSGLERKPAGVRKVSPGMCSYPVPASMASQQLAERDLSLAAHDEVGRSGRPLDVGLRGQARVVPAHGDEGLRPQRAHEVDELLRGAALERHDREADQVGPLLPHEGLDRGAHAVLDQDQVGHRDAMARIHVAGEGREGAVGHADGEGRHVLERVRHRKEEHVHATRLAVIDVTPITPASQPAYRGFGTGACAWCRRYERRAHARIPSASHGCAHRLG